MSIQLFELLKKELETHLGALACEARLQHSFKKGFPADGTNEEQIEFAIENGGLSWNSMFDQDSNVFAEFDEATSFAKMLTRLLKLEEIRALLTQEQIEILERRIDLILRLDASIG